MRLAPRPASQTSKDESAGRSRRRDGDALIHARTREWTECVHPKLALHTAALPPSLPPSVRPFSFPPPSLPLSPATWHVVKGASDTHPRGPRPSRRPSVRHPIPHPSRCRMQRSFSREAFCPLSQTSHKMRRNSARGSRARTVNE